MSRTARDIEMTSPTSHTARDAYREHHSAALALLARISAALQDPDAAPSPEELDWGHVGDMAETEKELRLIADRLFGEGEFAPENE